MHSAEISNPIAPADSWRLSDTLAAIALFSFTAIVVVWQNLRLGVLWDLSYILENAHRISLGDVPYKDFPFPYAPITFLIQAAIIKLTGHVFFHHIIYAALAGGVGTVLTWRILLHILRGKIANHRLVAFLLSAPLTILGIYCIYPHPFYDPDCTIAILCGVLLLQRLEIYKYTPTRAFCCGAVLLIPLFVKQNTGLVFLACIGSSLAFLASVNLRRAKSVNLFLYVFAGILTAFIAALALIHHFAGLTNYWHWTIQFASERRTPQIADMLQPFQNYDLLIWLACAIAGIFLARGASKRTGKLTRVLIAAAILLITAPFIWSVIYLFLDDDPSSRAERLLALWPFVLIVSFAIGLFRARRQQGINLVLPFVLIGTILGAFLSQQLWGSTYAIWPLLIILIAILIAELAPHFQHARWLTTSIATAIAASMLVSGAFYVISRERLSYANVWEGEITRSNFPQLKGLSVRGPWIPQFEELVRFSEKEIPKDDGILMIPGEDLFYYTTGRHPRFPVLMFDHTVNPYSPLRVQAVAKSANIDWLVVKRNLQIQGSPYEDEAQLLQLLLGDFQLAQHLENYDVYKRK
jgi:hypothetical protein